MGRKPKEVNDAAKSLLQRMIPTRNPKPVMSPFPGYSGFKWGDPGEDEAIYIRDEYLIRNTLEVVDNAGGEEEIKYAIATLSQVKITFGDPMLLLHLSFGNKDAFVWHTDDPDYRKIFYTIAKRTYLQNITIATRYSHFDIDFKTLVQDVVDDLAGDANILKYKELPDEVTNFDEASSINDSIAAIVASLGGSISDSKTERLILKQSSDEYTLDSQALETLEQVKQTTRKPRHIKNKKSQPVRVPVSDSDDWIGKDEGSPKPHFKRVERPLKDILTDLYGADEVARMQEEMRQFSKEIKQERQAFRDSLRK